MATETLNIKVKEDGGSRRVANEFKSLAREVMRAGKEFGKFKRQIKSGVVLKMKKDITVTNRAVKNLTTSTKAAATGVRKFNTSIKKTRGPMEVMAGNMSKMRGLMFSLGAIAAGSTFLSYSDQFQSMNNRIKLVTGSTKEFKETQSRLQGIAKDTRQSLTATVETYVRMRKATKDAGVSSERLFGVLGTLNKMMAISGASSQEAEQSIRQLSQAFSKGKLDGDEFRTVSEAMPDILDALQSSLGVTRGELRKMSEAGKLTTEVLLTAFEGVSQKVDKEFNQSVKTFGQSWQLLKDEVLKAVGELNNSTGAIGLVQKAMGLLASNIGLVVIALEAFATVMAVKMLVSIPALAVAIHARLVPALGKLTLWLGSVDTAAGITARSLKAMSIGALAAGIAGFKAGQFLDKALNLSDKLAGITAEHRNSDPVKAVEFALARAQKRLDTVNKQIAGTGPQFVKVSEEKLDKDKKIYAKQLQILEALHAQAVETARIKELQEEYKKTVEETAPAWNKVLSVTKPVTAAYESMNAQISAIRKNVDLDIGQRVEMIARIRKSFRSKVSPESDEFEKTSKALEDTRRGIKEINKALGKGLGKKEAREASKEIVQYQRDYEDLLEAFTDANDTGTAQDVLVARATSAAQQRQKLRKEKKELEKLTDKSSGKKDTTAKDLAALLSSINPVLKAQKDLEKSTKLLDKAERRGLITTKKRAEVLGILKTNAEAALFPRKEMLRIAQEESKLAGMSQQDQDRLNLEKEIENDLIAKTGKELSLVDQILVKVLATKKQHTNAVKEQNAAFASASEAIVSEVEALQALEFQIAAINKERGKGLTDKEANSLIIDQLISKHKGLEGVLSGVKDATIGLSKVQKQKALIDRFDASMQILLQDLKKNAIKGTLSQAEAEKRLLLIRKGLVDELKNLEKEEAKKEARGKKEEAKTNRDLTAGIQELLSPEALETQAIDAVTNAFLGLEDQIVSLVTTGKFSFKEMIDSMLADVTRLTFRSFISTAAGIAAAQHGGTITVGQQNSMRKVLPSFQHGGQFSVGGEGGVDSQLVQFMASPGEKVTITNPGQSRLDSRPAPVSPPEVNITNVVDPSQFGSALSSPAGQRAVINVVEMNSSLLKKLLA